MNLPCPCPPAVVGEPEEGKGLGPPLAPLASRGRSYAAKLDQPGLLLVQREAEYGQALPELGQHRPRIRLPLESDDEIVSMAHDHDTTAHSPLSRTPARNHSSTSLRMRNRRSCAPASAVATRGRPLRRNCGCRHRAPSSGHWLMIAVCSVPWAMCGFRPGRKPPRLEGLGEPDKVGLVDGAQDLACHTLGRPRPGRSCPP
jgi:hypothetical protein